LILAVNQLIFILIPVFFYIVVNNISIKDVLRFNRLDFYSAITISLISFPLYIVAVALNSTVLYALQFIGYVPVDSIPAPGNSGELFIEILVVAVSPAICEEILHRGVLLKAYESRGSMKAIIITSILFGIFHYDITNFVGPVFLGLLIGYYVIRTNSIFAGMLAHFANNLISVIFQYYYSSSGEEINDTRITVAQLGEILVYGAVCAMIVLVLVACFYLTTRGKYLIKPSTTTFTNDVISIVSHWPITISFILYVLIALNIVINYALKL
jgi:membrane protease YdiL (CAAX protease family)